MKRPGRRAVLVTAAGAAAAAALFVWIRCGPLPDGFLDPDPHRSVEMTDRHGEPLYELLSARGGRSRGLSAEQLPERLIEATVAAEDRRFFSHPGVDPIALLRAALRNARAGAFVEGGSTLTQQVVKQIAQSGGRGRTLTGKLREMLYALRLEQRLGKREILALYLNLAPYGGQLVGAGSASLAYFGLPPANLTPAQAALLASLPRAPGRLDPLRDPDAAARRQRLVISRMERLGFLDAAEAAIARRERLRLLRPDRATPAPHFVERVLSRESGRRPRRIQTTLDLPLQRAVGRIIDSQREALLRHGAHNVAVAVLDNASGDWLAWEGSGNYGEQAHGAAIDGVVAPRQPGSALKPFTYALAFEKGFTPGSVLPDVPSHFPTSQPGILYSPRNYDGVFRGPLRARAALAGSENVPAVWLLSQVGVTDLLRLLRTAGFTTLTRTSDYYGFGLTMGDAEVPLAEVVAAYAAFARGGVYRRPRMIRGTVEGDGASAPGDPPGVGGRIVSPRTAYWITDILSDAAARAYAFGEGGSLDFPYPVAVKTGTSQAYRDNWTVGYTRAVSVGVWVGNFDRSELKNSSGVTGAGPIFHAVLEAAQMRVAGKLPSEQDPPLASPPSALEPRALCALSGLEATPACPGVQTEWLEARRLAECAWHRPGAPTAAVAWPAEYHGWARDRGLPVRPTDRAVELAASGRPLAITNPPAGAIYLRDPTLRSEFQALALRAVAAGGARRLRWQVDGRTIGEVGSDRALDWPLAAGRHTVRVEDERGFSDQTTILVK
ncbi:MAG: penicillin-binding protein 1C [Thermoanaerobaculia bacterium]